MGDLLIITPTRQRPGNAARLAGAVAATCTAQTDLIFAIDDDDGSYADVNLGAAKVIRGPRATCGQWTNLIARACAGEYRALASLGDDHLPRTHGWDSALLAAIDAMGGTGIAYGDDIGQGKNLPTAPVISSGIIAALGYFFLPALAQFFADNVWLDLGREAGCLAYLPDVTVEHLHYTRGAAPHDQVYEEARDAWMPDQAAYWAWQRADDGLRADVAKIRELRDKNTERTIKEGV